MLTKQEKNWILYDVGNSAFIMLVSTIIPIYFKNMASMEGISDSDSTAYWGYAASVATLVIALIGPILGTMGDNKGYKKKFFALFVGLGVAGCFSLAMTNTWLGFLSMFIIGKIGYSGSLIFYDSMLIDITDDLRLDMVSSHGYAWGYIGSCIPFVMSLGLVLTAESTGIGTINATKMSFLINGIWWLLLTIPIYKSYEQKYFIETKTSVFAEAYSRIKVTLGDIKNNKKIFTFLAAFFLYIDGVYTIIEMATSYGKDVGISDNQMLMAFLLTQIVAFPFAILFGKLSKKYSAENLLKISIVGYLGITIFALQLDKAWEFWILAVWVAVFQGGIQALSRSYFAKIIPKEKSNEYFGFYDIFGKGAAFMGTLMVGVITQLTGSSTYGVASLAILFILGFIVFSYHQKISE